MSYRTKTTGCSTRTAQPVSFGQSLLVLALMLGVICSFLPVADSYAADMPPMPVETIAVRVDAAEQQLAAVGSLQSNESLVVRSEIAGRIVRIAFDEGTRVKKGDLLFRLDDAVLKAQLDQARANLALHEADYKRAEALLADHAIAQQERDTAYAQWQLDKASVALAEAQWQKTRIRAPFSGTLGLKQVSPGDFIQPGQALVNLEDTATLKVEFPVPEKYAAQVKEEMEFVLTTDSAPQATTGKVYARNPQIDAASRSLLVRGRLDNAAGQLLPGLFAQVKLTLAKIPGALFIPEQAVIPQAKANLVFKVVDGKAQMVPVELGQRRIGWVQITSGLAEGDVVVTGGHQKIGPGSPVMPIPADPELFAKLD